MAGFLDRKTGIFLLITQAVFLVLFGFLTFYEEAEEYEDLKKYAYFQDIHIMIFIGFGFLMTFLKKYGYGAVSFNLIVAAMAIQWALICQRMLDNKAAFNITFAHLLEADIAAAAVLISFGAVLGRLHPFQLFAMTLIEIVLFSVNFFIGVHCLNALDAGGSIFVHTFGAYFGLAVARVIHKDHHVDHHLAASNYQSDLFSMVGTIFLWICWPSFNAALVADEAGQYRAIVNTYLSLVACTIVAAAVSSLIHKETKMNMVHLQNATLAGGVAAGACANFEILPVGALAIGCVAGAVSVIGYDHISPFLASKLKIFDTCGVNNLHGMPGIMSALASTIAILFATKEGYGDTDFAATFPMRVLKDDAWTATQQAAMQMAALGVTLVIAIVGGAITGLLLRIPLCGQLTQSQVYNDTPFWELPDGDDDDGQELKDRNGA